MKRLFLLTLVLMLIISTVTGCTQVTLGVEDEPGTESSNRSIDPEGTTVSESISSSDYSQLFATETVHEVRIEIEESEWQAILDAPEAEEYHPATVTVDGEKAEEAGIRTKGNSSLKSVAASESNRYSFRVNLGKYVDGQELLGLDEFVLNNMFSDPSYLREYMSYEIMREMGLNVPLTSFVNVYVNDELFGFYLMVEAIDDSFLSRSFGDNEGNLYKAEMNSTLQVESDGSYDSYEQKNGEDESKSDLVTLIETLNDMPEGEKGEIETVLDVESALKYIAANMILINSDSYNGNFAQNYYLYNQGGYSRLFHGTLIWHLLEWAEVARPSISRTQSRTPRKKKRH